MPASVTFEAGRNMLSKAERRCQSGRLDAKKIDQAWHSMFAFAVDAEIASGLTRTDNFCAHAGIAGTQDAMRQAGPVPPDRLIERHCPARINVIVN